MNINLAFQRWQRLRQLKGLKSDAMVAYFQEIQVIIIYFLISYVLAVFTNSHICCLHSLG